MTNFTSALPVHGNMTEAFRPAFKGLVGLLVRKIVIKWFVTGLKCYIIIILVQIICLHVSN
jgi:hypothetical protein